MELVIIRVLLIFIQMLGMSFFMFLPAQIVAIHRD